MNIAMEDDSMVTLLLKESGEVPHEFGRVFGVELSQEFCVRGAQ